DRIVVCRKPAPASLLQTPRLPNRPRLLVPDATRDEIDIANRYGVHSDPAVSEKYPRYPDDAERTRYAAGAADPLAAGHRDGFPWRFHRLLDAPVVSQRPDVAFSRCPSWLGRSRLAVGGPRASSQRLDLALDSRFRFDHARFQSASR